MVRRTRALVTAVATFSLLTLPGVPLASAATPATTASLASVSASASGDPIYLNATNGVQCDASATLAAVRSDGTQQRLLVSSPAASPRASAGARTAMTPGLVDFEIVDEGKLGVGLIKQTTGFQLASYSYDVTTNRWRIKAQLANGIRSTGTMLAQGRGVVYVILTDGTMRFYQVAADGSRVTISGAMSTSGWAGARTVTGTGNGSIFVLSSTGQVKQWVKDRPFLATGSVRYLGVVATRPELATIAGSGDGVLWGATKTGTLVRLAQYAPGRSLTVNTVPGVTGLTNIIAFTADPNACGDGETQVRAQIAANALRWKGTGDAFCDTYDCNPRGWWCQDFTWASWFNSGVEYTSRYRTDRYVHGAPNVVSDPYLYAAAYKTPIKTNYRSAKVGDLVIWDSAWFNGKSYVGHNAVITRVYYNNGVPNGYFDFMHGNFGQSVVFQGYQSVYTAHTLGYPDGFVSPRL